MFLLLLAALLLLALLIAALWAMVTQPTRPLRSRNAVLQQKESTASGVEPARLEAHVRMLAETLAPRDHSHPQNLDRVAAYIRQEFESAKAEAMTEQPFTVRGITYRNVIARFGPDTSDRIVVGAHYDAAGPLPGADDNASGIAGLIELAHLLGRGEAPPLRVDLVAFCLEEPPYFATEHMGSAVHAASLRKEGVAVRAMFCLEMIGYFTDAPNSQNFPSATLKPFYPSEGNFITIAARPSESALQRRIKEAMRAAASPLPVHSLTAPVSLSGIDLSDHRSYWNVGYPAVMITDSAFYRNRNYHTPQDLPETLDYTRMALVVQGLDAAVREVAVTPQPEKRKKHVGR